MAELAGNPGGGQLAIQPTGTKRVTALISPPHGSFIWDAVTATSGTTFIAVPPLAASQDGYRIAYVVENNGVTTLNVITGSTARHWMVPAMGGLGSTGLMPGDLSLTADGSELAFITFRVADTVGPVRAAGTVWLLPVSSAPGTLSAYSTADGALLRTVHTWTGVPDASAVEPGMSVSGSQLLVWGLGDTAYQVDTVSGATKPVWVYSLHDKGQSGAMTW
jgi:hypothetical protein